MAYKDDIYKELKEVYEKIDAVEKDFKLGDMVVCTENDVVGEVIKIFTTPDCNKQLLVRTFDGIRYRAPINAWKRYDFGLNGLTPKQFIVDVLEIKLDAYQEQVLDLMSDYNKRRIIEQIMNK